MTAPQIMTITDSAAEQIKTLLNQTDDSVIGLRVAIKARGCSGMAYDMQYATEAGAQDEVVEDKGVKIFVDPQSVMFLLGTQIDYVRNEFEEGFTFSNPNEKGRCGCGESFHTEETASNH